MVSVILGTREAVVRWYCFDPRKPSKATGFTLADKLDLKAVAQFPDKVAAKRAAELLGLPTWRFVAID